MHNIYIYLNQRQLELFRMYNITLRPIRDVRECISS